MNSELLKDRKDYRRALINQLNASRVNSGKGKGTGSKSGLRQIKLRKKIEAVEQVISSIK